MLGDIVIDANVLMHADDPRQEIMKQNCLKLIKKIYESVVFVCVDEGFDLQEGKNRSQIGSEYLRHLRSGTVGYNLVVHLAKNARIIMISKSVSQAVAKSINQQIRPGADRIYVKVAYNSKNKIFVSHDHGDLPETVRARLKKGLGISTLTASDSLSHL